MNKFRIEEINIKINKPIDPSLTHYIKKFSGKIHYKRNIQKIKENDPDWRHNCFCGCLGPDGLFYIGPYKEDIKGASRSKHVPTAPEIIVFLLEENEIKGKGLLSTAFYDIELIEAQFEWLRFIYENFICVFDETYHMKGYIKVKSDDPLEEAKVFTVNDSEIVELEKEF